MKISSKFNNFVHLNECNSVNSGRPRSWVPNLNPISVHQVHTHLRPTNCIIYCEISLAEWHDMPEPGRQFILLLWKIYLFYINVKHNKKWNKRRLIYNFCFFCGKEFRAQEHKKRREFPKLIFHFGIWWKYLFLWQGKKGNEERTVHGVERKCFPIHIWF